MVMSNDRPLATLLVLLTLATEAECESFNRKKERKRGADKEESRMEYLKGEGIRSYREMRGKA